MIATRFVEGQEVAKSLGRPKLPRTLEAALFLPAGGFHRAGTNRPAPPSHLLIVHSLGVAGKIGLFALDDRAGFSHRRLQTGDFAQTFLFLTVLQPMQAAVHPTGQLPVLFSAHCAPEVPTVLAGLIKVQQPDGIRPAVLLKVPNPRSAIAQKQNMPGPRQAAALRFPIQSPAQFQGCSLPTDDHFVGQQSPVARRSPPLLVPIKHPGLEFVPFHAGLPAFLLSPARSALAHHPAVHHQDGQRAGRPLRLRLGRDRGQAFLRLSFGQRSQALHQLTGPSSGSPAFGSSGRPPGRLPRRNPWPWP